MVVETTVVTCEGREVKDGSLKHVEEEGVAVGGKHGSPGTTWGEFPLYNITRLLIYILFVDACANKDAFGKPLQTDCETTGAQVVSQ